VEQPAGGERVRLAALRRERLHLDPLVAVARDRVRTPQHGDRTQVGDEDERVGVMQPPVGQRAANRLLGVVAGWVGQHQRALCSVPPTGEQPHAVVGRVGDDERADAAGRVGRPACGDARPARS
jgi:hypothetical protein